MRMDRAITLNLTSPILRLVSSPQSRQLPVLMYHSILEKDESSAHPYHWVCTSPVTFESQMKSLAEMGYRGVTLSEGLEAYYSGKGEELVVITFDDGFRNFMTDAMPVLRRLKFDATMYLATGFIGDVRKSYEQQECLTWSEVRDLAQEGIEFGSHTVSHPRLVDLTRDAIREELKRSKAVIEQHLGKRVTAFAHPFAYPQHQREWVLRFRELLLEEGYRTNATTILGRVSGANDPLAIPRLPVNNGDDTFLLHAKIRGAYDWVSWPQILSKKIRINWNRINQYRMTTIQGNLI